MADPAAAERAAVALLTGPDLGPVLAAALRPAGLRAQRWTLRRVHHRPGAGVSAVVDVTARRNGGDPGRDSDRRSDSGRHHEGDPSDSDRSGGSRRREDGGRSVAQTVCVSTAAAPGSAPAARIRHRGLELLAWRHPFDPWLPGLAFASSPAAVGRAVFGSARPARLDELAYRPTRRAVVRAVHARGVRYLKVLGRGRAAALLARHRVLRDAGLPVPAAGTVPGDGIGAGPTAGAGSGIVAGAEDVVVLHALGGAPLAAMVRRDGAAALAPEHVLALLDALPAAVLELPARVSWTDRVLDHARAAALALPGEAGRIGRAARAIDAARDATDPGPVVPVHGDLYEANLRTGPAAGPAAAGPFGPLTGLLDLDTLGPGHRVDDLACLVAHLAVLPTVDARHVHAPAAARRLLAGFDAAVDPAALRVRAAGVALSLVAGARRAGGPPGPARGRLEVAEQFLRDSEGPGRRVVLP